MTLSKNGYLLDAVIRDVINNFHRVKPHLVKKCPVYLRLPFIGSEGESLARRISFAINNCYFSANVRVIFVTRPILSSIHKDVPPTIHIMLTKLFTNMNVVVDSTT